MQPSRHPLNVLITGAGGFVGRWLTRELASALPAGSTVTPAGMPGADPELGPAFDVVDAHGVAATVERVRPTCVVHLAAVSTVGEARQDAGKAWHVNLFGTMHLAEAVLKHVPEARFIFVSTSEVYGASFNTETRPLDENAPLHPLNAYAATKAAAELALGQMAQEGLRVIRFRPFNHTGPGQTTSFVVPAFAAQVAAIERGMQPPVVRVGNLDARRDFLDVRDVVAAYRKAVLADHLPDRAILNLASGTPRRIGAVLDALLSMARVPIRIEHDPSRMRPNDVPVTSGDAGRARDALGWRPEIPWESTLRDILEHQRSQYA